MLFLNLTDQEGNLGLDPRRGESTTTRNQGPSKFFLHRNATWWIRQAITSGRWPHQAAHDPFLPVPIGPRAIGRLGPGCSWQPAGQDLGPGPPTPRMSWPSSWTEPPGGPPPPPPPGERLRRGAAVRPGADLAPAQPAGGEDGDKPVSR